MSNSFTNGPCKNVPGFILKRRAISQGVGRVVAGWRGRVAWPGGQAGCASGLLQMAEMELISAGTRGRGRGTCDAACLLGDQVVCKLCLYLQDWSV